MKYKTLSIAGFDGSGGAGIQADLKTFSALGCYGMTVLTAIPVQNTCGVKSCYDIELECIEEQLTAIFTDIIPDSIKIGMLFSAPIIELVADFLTKHAQNIPIVLDPVMVAKSGDPLLKTDAINALKTNLISLATVLTPNLPEAFELLGKNNFILIDEANDMQQLVEQLIQLGSQAVLLKGGHTVGTESNDLLVQKNIESIWLKAKRISSNNTHGTGCTLSAAICAYLAKGYTIAEACSAAKDYLLAAIKASAHNSVGKGKGPVHHFYNIW